MKYRIIMLCSMNSKKLNNKGGLLNLTEKEK